MGKNGSACTAKPGPELLRVKQLCDYLARTLNPKMKWMWGEALLGYAMVLLDEYLGAEDYTAFLTAYCDYYVAHPPRVDYADTAAPALITYSMQKKTGNGAYAQLTGRVLDYIRYEPRILGDAVNDLGKSPEGKFYPKSIWVDSLRMFSVFPALYARENQDQELLHGVRCGYLPQRPYRAAGEKAFQAVLRHLVVKPDGEVYLSGISAPTIPLQVFPCTCYRLTPRGKNWSYGVAAAVFAALEYDRLQHIMPENV